jgi:hypothetical protein
VLLAHDDGNLGSFSLRAGALNAGGMSKDGKRLIDVLPTGNIAVGEKMMEMEKAIIHDAFLITLFQILVDTPQMTATEVLERAREKGMLLAPTAGRLQAEFLGPMIEREITCSRAGLDADLPQILIDAAVEYKHRVRQPAVAHGARREGVGLHARAVAGGRVREDDGRRRAAGLVRLRRAMPEILDINGSPIAWTRSLEDSRCAPRPALAGRSSAADGRRGARRRRPLMKAAPA